MKDSKYLKILLLLVISFSSLVSFAQKTDTIVHINGNILTGDFKRLNSGVVTWKMDGMGTISLEEPKIQTIISNKLFEIKMDNGRIYFGSFEASENPRTVNLILLNEKISVKVEDIVEVYPIRNSFFRRLSGNFSLGANYAKGSNVATLVFSGNLDYRKRNSIFSLFWDTNDTYQGDSLSSSKSDVVLGWQRNLSKGWATDVSIGVSQNLQLGTDLRWNLNLGALKDLMYNEWNRLYFSMGLNMSREIPVGEGAIKEDLAGLFQLKWKIYKLTGAKVWLDADITYLPYITNDTRNRVSVNLNPKVSIFSNNFKIGLSFYYTYDSRPQNVDAANDDYGLNLQFTYSLN
ncbi:DUF481 domain-containing protein [Lutimonas saemankumensis]|uniref:DUF481 domain-containing protein n=1 Tax=Lutimonas saemankumensis TaxID=483016 RepID=UPI001CD34BCB|nr:DUF481 domain-containing protein [Lutimonas saemankumensis]MCA0930899.1 DUF481 domain-containing protein [Lutimonas saemankumensis]